jgi:hypothetical protein
VISSVVELSVQAQQRARKSTSLGMLDLVGGTEVGDHGRDKKAHGTKHTRYTLFVVVKRSAPNVRSICSSPVNCY